MKQPNPNIKPATFEYHRFLDEAGDPTFYGKGRIRVVGTEGVSRAFILGMLKINEPLGPVRNRVVELQNLIGSDGYFRDVPSITRKRENNGYFLHAKDDIPEVRKMAFDLIRGINCSFEAIVARKIYDIFETQHEGKETLFYADLLSHLLKSKLEKYDKLVLNIARRNKCTSEVNLPIGWEKAKERSLKKSPEKEHACTIVFNVQEPTTEPLINIADYFCWAVQRVFEKGETRFYDYISDQVALVVDLYDTDHYRKGENFYTRRKKLTKDNLLK
ncbi:MAG: hypothetical protein M0Q26_13545 [Chitinophagaceae bacterium]|nr:hypothetical protein [Chitinophagaceae bacterium]